MALKHGSVWDDIALPAFPRLDADAVCDAAVIGGGITGITAAYFLASAGLRVILLEKDRLCFGATGATTAFLSSIIDTNMSDLASTYGARVAKAVIASHARAIDTIEDIVRREKIDCDFMRCANFLYGADESQHSALEEEYKASKKLGYSVKGVELPFEHFGAFKVERQGKFHPLKYLSRLVDIADARGASVFEKSEALALERDGADFLVRTKKGSVRAPFVFLATYEPFTKPLSLYFKKAFYTTYMYAGTVETKRFPEGIYEDLSNPYNYFRIDRGEKRDRFILGGQDHRSDVKVSAEKNFKALGKTLDAIMGDAPYELERKWMGPILEPLDGLPYIGPFGENGYVAMGFSGNGMTYGTIAAMMFCDRVRGKKNAWEKLYNPSRIGGFKRLAVKGRDYVGELVGGALHNALAYRAK